MLTLAEVLDSERALGGAAATLVVITPDIEDLRLAEHLEEWQARGGQHFGFALDAASFRTGRAALPDTFGGANVRIIRHGDDLRTILERHDDGWAG